ncbi:hypothetical protein CXU22_01210 [Akkermansia muciniphila]|uniref:SGNH hydrolase-type esterase domain-containing protein n=2 Tax=Akkermansia muciniphila TaxID=239935 RepID=A0A2N8HFX4_9BACT|nr:hypothetical protein CXU22_01210 [Akkermansia muciniphila]
MRITGKMKVPVFLAALLFLPLSSVFAEKSPEKLVPDLPDVPKMNTQHWVPARYKVVREQLLGKECGVLFVGDSITQGWEQEGAEYWKKLFLPMKAVNFGVSGDRTESMLWRMEDTGLAVKTPPCYCILLAGTNNIGRWEGRQPAEETVKGIREVAVRLLKKFPETRLILMEVTPYGPDPSAPLRKRQEEINERLRRLELPRTTVLSINGRLLNADGTFREGMFRDKVHLTPKGYQVWAEALLPLLDRKS